MFLPSLIIFISNCDDLHLQNIKTQLFIHDTIDFNEFNARLSVDPNYIFRIKNNNLRVLVLLDNLSNYVNRQFADIVISVNNGFGFIEKNKFGPPGQVINLDRVNIFKIFNFKN